MKTLFVSLIALVATMAMAAGTVEEAAKKAGCTLNESDKDICTYKETSIKGHEAILKINKLLHVELNESTTIWGYGSDCVAMWNSSTVGEWGKDKEAPLIGQLTFVNPESGEQIGQFWFGRQYSYTLQKVDIAFETEADFFVDHIFRVSGRSNKDYKLVLNEHGDSHFGITLDGKKIAEENYCEIEF